MQFKTLALIYTWKCNAACESCCYSCHPKRTEKIPLYKALSIVQEAAKIDDIQHLSITGGEPFIYLDDVKEILYEWEKSGKTSNCVTNAFWATSYEKAIKTLRHLKNVGLTTLSLSYDIYHEKFIPVERIIKALKAASDIGLNLEINCVRGKSDPCLSELLPEITNFKGVFQEGMLVPSGRGALFSPEKFSYLDVLPVERCGMLNTLAITPNGMVYPCCSVFGETEFLSLGNINNSSLSTMVEEAQANILFLLLERQGFGTVIDLGKKINPEMPLPVRVVNTCHLCHELFSNPKSASSIWNGMKQFEMEFLAESLKKLDMK